MKGKTKVLYILISFLAAVLLWVYVVGVERPQKEDVIRDVPVTFVGEDVIYEDYGLIITSERRPTVSLTVFGGIKDIAALNTNKESIVVEASVDRVRGAGTEAINYTVTLPNDNVTLLDQSPYTLSVHFDKVVTVAVPVKLINEGSVTESYIAKTPVIEPASLQITGPEDLVYRVDHAEVVWTRENMDQTLSLDLGYTLVDENSQVIEDEHEELVGNHDVINVTIPIQKTKRVPLTVDFTDGGGATEKNASYNIEPATIEIAGEPSKVEGLNVINVADIELKDVVGSWSERYEIVLPNGVESISGETNCKVKVQMTGLKIVTIQCDNITAIYPPDGCHAESLTRERSVTLRGPIEDIDRMKASDVRIVADLAAQDITDVGRYTVPAIVYVDGFTTISELYPVNIAVDIIEE